MGGARPTAGRLATPALAVAFALAGVLTACTPVGQIAPHGVSPSADTSRTSASEGVAATFPPTTSPMATGVAPAAASTGTSPAPAPPATPRSTPVSAFDPDNALAYIRHLSDDIGVRRGGSDAETRAIRYVYEALRSWGYSDATIREVPIPNGRTSHVVYATRPGTERSTVVLGAHIDSKVPSPGANDNGSGSGVLLELARDLKDSRITSTVTFVWFGNEEMIDHDGDHHHYGSRWFVRHMPAGLRRDLVGMVSVDMVGYGDRLLVRSMDQGPRAMVDLVLARFRESGQALRYSRDPGTYGWSDHEPFELAGIPAAWLEWNDDPTYHTARDTGPHLQRDPIARTGRALRTMIVGLKTGDLAALRAARR